MRRSCNLAAAPMPASVTENACSFSYTFSREKVGEGGRGGARPGCNGDRGSGAPWDNRRHHPCFPDPLVLVPRRQTLIDVIFTLDTRPSFCNLLRSVPASFPSNLISALSRLLDTFAVNNAVTIMRQSQSLSFVILNLQDTASVTKRGPVCFERISKWKQLRACKISSYLCEHAMLLLICRVAFEIYLSQEGTTVARYFPRRIFQLPFPLSCLSVN
jgi:hypothetical protein